MTDNLIQTNFVNGELSPTVFGREDLSKIRAGAARMRNFFVDYRGGASTRSGTQFIGQVKNSALPVKLFRFQFSVLQAYVLELGDHYMRFIVGNGYVLYPPATITSATLTSINAANDCVPGDSVYLSVTGLTYVVTEATGTTLFLTNPDGSPAVNLPNSGTVAVVYTLTTPWAAADLASLKFTQSADVVTFTHPSYPPYDLNRLADNNWTITPVTFAATIYAPVGLHLDNLPNTASTAAYYEYVVTSVSAAGEESLPSAMVGLFCQNMGISQQTLELTWIGATGASYYNVYRASAFNGFKVPGGAVHGFVGQTAGTQFVDSNIIANFTQTSPKHYDPFTPGQIISATIVAQGSGYTAPSVAITDSAGGGGGAYGVITLYNGTAIVGFTLLTNGGNYHSPIATITDSTGSGGSITVAAGPLTGTWPSTCSYFQQRRVFAASNNFPETIWGSKVGLPSNFDTSNPVIDSDSYQFTLSSNQVNNIKWMVSMPGGLVLFTGSGVWQLSGGGNNQALTPSNAIANPQSYTGCADVPPIPINYSILYVQEKGSVVRDLAYNFYANIYTGNDTTVLSNHLFYGHQIIDWAYAEEPFKIIWAVRDDGVLLSLTYLKEQEINGWARHDTNGVFESVTVIPSTDGKEDVTYFVVRRLVNGVWLRFVESMVSRNYSSGNDSPWCVDCGKEFLLGQANGSPAALSTASGTATFTAPGQNFNPEALGYVLRFGGGRGTVTEFINSTTLIVEMSEPVTQTLANGIPLEQSSWALSSYVTTVNGLDHLNGETVVALADGLPAGPFIVLAGQITLDVPATRIIIGFGFNAQLQTMYAEGGNQTIQGKRKQIQAATARLNQTRGLQIGVDFEDMQPIVNYDFGPIDPLALISEDQRLPLPGDWNEYGQICFEQDQPLPATVLAVVYEINVGN